MNNNHVYDMLVVGGGPGGYTAALYAARAGLDTVVLEKLSAGGQMALTEQIDNYPGFEDGIDGFSLAEKMQKQAERFGVRSEYAEVLRMDLTAVPKRIETSGGTFFAKTLVYAAGAVPRELGVPETVIALTFVALGTSLPELVTTITAIVKKQSSLSAGNIIGANIIDLTLILPACALIYGGKLPVIGTVGILDMPACLLIGLICVVPTLITRTFSRWQGICVLLVYVTYVVITVAFGDALASAVAPAVALMTM